jgi:O-palmitoleoyl-L-serine hydrolase
LSTDPQISRFANWTKVVIMYCDGAQHQGHVKDPVSFKDTKLYFRGSANTRSHFQWLLNTYKINTAEKVLLTGASAGGIATFTWSNYMRGLLD